MGAAAIIPAIIGAAGTAGGGLLAGRGNKAQRRAAQAQADLINFQRGVGGQLVPQAQALLTQGAGTYGPIIDYYSKLLGGDRTALMQLLGPEIQNIQNQYTGAIGTSSELNPRGGIPAAMRANLPFQEARDIGNLFMAVRPMAAQGLFAVGSDLSRLGLGAFGTALGGAGQAGQSAAALGSLGAQLAAQGFAGGQAFGDIAYNIARKIPWGKIFNKSGTGSPGAGPTGPGPGSPDTPWPT